jgi:hypothetical protein
MGRDGVRLGLVENDRKGWFIVVPLNLIPSFPRKREPIYPLGSKSEIVERWVPAFAGMTTLGMA